MQKTPSKGTTLKKRKRETPSKPVPNTKNTMLLFVGTHGSYEHYGSRFNSIPFPCHPIDSLILENKSNEKNNKLKNFDRFFAIFNEDKKYNYPRRNDVDIEEGDKNRLNELERKYADANTRPTDIDEDKELYCKYFNGYDGEAGGKRRSTRRKRRKRKYTRKRR